MSNWQPCTSNCTMEDKKLKQKCWVVLEDCFKGFGDDSVYEVRRQIEPLSNTIKSTELRVEGQCVSNSDRLKQHTHLSPSKEGKRSDNSKQSIAKKSKSSMKSYRKITKKKITIPTTKCYVSLLSSASPWRNQTKSFSSLISLIHGETPEKTLQTKCAKSPQIHSPAKLFIESEQTTRIICENAKRLDILNSHKLPAASTDNLILDPKDGKLYTPASSIDALILDPKGGKLSEVSTDGLILDPKDGALSKPTTSTVESILKPQLAKPAASCDDLILDPKDGVLYKPASSAKELVIDSKNRKLCKPPVLASDFILEPTDGKLFGSAPAADDGLILDSKDGKLYSNPLRSMPTVGLTIDAGIGCPLPSLSAKCVLTCLDECKNFLTAEFAEFCSTVVNTSPNPKSKRMILPIKDERVLQLMQIKWNSKSAVKPVSLSACLNAPKLTPIKPSTKSGNNAKLKQNCDKQNLESNQTALYSISNRKIVSKKHVNEVNKMSNVIYGSQWGTSLKRTKMSLLDNDKKKILPLEIDISDHDASAINSSSLSERSVGLHTKSVSIVDSDDEDMRTVTKKTAFEISEAPYDPDDVRSINNSEEKAVEPGEVTRGKASHVMHELRRLNVAVFDMPTSLESVVCKLPDICRLGCVCSSLLSRVVRDNCGLETCMFGCICLKTPSFYPGNQSYTWVQNKAKQNLAKEERNFKQTVVRSGKDDLILVEGKRKREIKRPKKYSEDFLSCSDLKQSKTMRELFDDEDISNNVGNQAKQAKRVKLASHIACANLSSVPTDKENSSEISAYTASLSVPTHKENLPVSSTYAAPLNSILMDCARTAFYDYKSSKAFQSKQKQLEIYKTTKEIDLDLFKIASTQSIDQKDWEYPGSIETGNSVPSCSFLFEADFRAKNLGKVIIIPWDALWNDIVNKTAYVWYQQAMPKPKIYLTNSPTMPFFDCLDLQLVDVMSEVFTNLPNYLKALKTGCFPGSTNEVGWVVKFIRSHWMIMGHIQRNTPKGLSSHAKKSEQTWENEEVDILPSINEEYPSRWWVMNLSQDFDLIYFMDFKKALTKRQMNTLLRLSNEYTKGESKVHRILLNRQRPKSNATYVSCPDFGAYCVSDHPDKIFIGPYHSFKEPKFQVYSQKAAPNGKTQYVGVPLFYCGNQECVPVTSQGVLSLHSECLPVVYVQGFWYQSCGNNLRESIEKPQLLDTVGNQELGSHSKELDKVTLPSIPEINELTNAKDKTIPEILDITGDADKSSSEIIDIDVNGDDYSKNEATDSDAESSLNLMEQADEYNESSVDISIDELSNDKLQPTLPMSHSGLESQHLFENSSVSILQNIESVSPSCKSSVSRKAESDDYESRNQSATEEEELKIEYMIPNEPKIGYVTLTYLPGGAISVPHFTETGSLKFYHHKSEIVNELNRLIHKKLSCLSRKCSVFLQNVDDTCKCVAWSFSKLKPKSESVLEFTPEIFNGFFMLTNYGLLDLRSTQESIVQELGKDWVDWMKNDKIRLKLQHWKSKEEQEILESKLKTILSSNNDLPLLEVLSMATSEIAKLKAEDQLLDYESQSQKLLKETLISSLCRKLDGIPVDVVPKFLEHLEFSLLWEVLECMNNRKTILISLEKSDAPLPNPLLHDGDRKKQPPAPAVKSIKKKRGKKRVQSKNVNARVMSKAAPYSETLSPRSRALIYMERLREEIRLEEEQKLKLQQEKQQYQQQKLQDPTKISQKAKQQISLLRIDHNQAILPESSHSSNSANDGLQLKDGIACRMSPFSRINISVEGGGIKHLATSPPLRRSPGKPNILRKSKGSVGGVSPSTSQAQKQARKQVFPIKKGEEPLHVKDPLLSTPDSITTPLISDFDPISSLCITSVLSGAETVTDLVQDKDKLSPSISSHEPSSTFSQENLNSAVTNLKVGESSADPVSSLHIANVFSTRDISNKFPQTDISSVSPHTDPVSSLRISSVRSCVSATNSPETIASSVLTPLPAKNSPDPSTAFLEPKVIGVKTNCGPVVCRSKPGSLKPGQIISIPASSLPKSIFVCSKYDGKLTQTVPKSFKVRSTEAVSSHFKVADSKLKAVHVLKDSGYITFHSKVPTPKAWTQSLLSKTDTSLQLIKKQSNINEASSPEDESSK